MDSDQLKAKKPRDFQIHISPSHSVTEVTLKRVNLADRCFLLKREDDKHKEEWNKRSSEYSKSTVRIHPKTLKPIFLNISDKASMFSHQKCKIVITIVVIINFKTTVKHTSSGMIDSVMNSSFSSPLTSNTLNMLIELIIIVSMVEENTEFHIA